MAASVDIDVRVSVVVHESMHDRAILLVINSPNQTDAHTLIPTSKSTLSIRTQQHPSRTRSLTYEDTQTQTKTNDAPKLNHTLDLKSNAHTGLLISPIQINSARISPYNHILRTARIIT